MNKEKFDEMILQIWEVVNKYDVEGCVMEDLGEVIITLDCSPEFITDGGEV